MRPFHFHNPARVVFRPGGFRDLAGIAARTGKKALVVHGRGHLERSGRLGRILEWLDAAGVRTEVFGGVFPNPTFALAEEAAGTCRARGCDMVIGIGGASVLDTARAAACGVFVSGGLRRVFTGRKGVKRRLGLVLAPTLPGAGSATGCGMVLRDPERGVKLGFAAAALHADAVVIDPDLMAGGPPQALAAAAVDGFCHALEYAANHAARGDTLQLRLIAALARSIHTAGKRAAVARDPDSLAELAWAGELIMQGMVTAGLGWTWFPLHAVEHGMGGVLDTGHGQGLALLAGRMLSRGKAGPGHARFFRFLLPEAEGDDGTVIARAAQWFGEWLSAMGVETASLARMAAGQRERIATAAAIQAKHWRIRDIGRELELLA